MRIVTLVLSMLASALLVSGVAAAADQAKESANSGFLGNAYSNLKDATSPSGEKVKRWFSPGVTPGKYDSVLLDKSIFYPQPQSTDQVSTATLNDISAYFDEALRRELAGVVRMATEPGPKTLRFKPAITAAAPKSRGLKPYQYIPVAFIFTKVTGSEAKGASLAIEYEVQDTDTNAVVGAGVREGTGPELKNSNQKLTVEDFKPLIDGWAKDARAFIVAAKL